MAVFLGSTSVLSESAQFSCPRPSGVTAGVVLVAIQVASFGSSGDLATPTGGATWQQLDSGPRDDFAVWWKVAGSSEPSNYTFRHGGLDCIVAIAAVGNAAPTAPTIAVTIAGIDTTQPSTPSIASPGADAIEIRAAAIFDDDEVSWSAPSGFTLAESVSDFFADLALAMAWRVPPASGQTGTHSFQIDSEQFHAYSVTIGIANGAIDATPAPGAVAASAAMPTPGIEAGGTAHPDAASGAVAMPRPRAQGGATGRPDAVAAVTGMPRPTVIVDTGSAVIDVTPVTAAAALPMPDVTGVIHQVVSPPATGARVDLPRPTVYAERQVTAYPASITVTVDMPVPTVVVPVRPGDQLDGLAGQIEYNGFVLGRGTFYRIREIQGWRSKPPIVNGNVPRASAHGSYAGRPLVSERAITLSGLLRAPRDQIEAAIFSLEAATPIPPDDSEYPLVINDLGTPYLVYGRPDRLEIPVTQALRLGVAPFAVQWLCSDPRRYGLAQLGVNLPAGEPTIVANAGNEATHPRVRVIGPAKDPKLVNHTLNRVLEFTLELDDGEVLTIDTDQGTAFVGETSVIGRRVNSVPITDWVIGPGENELEYTVAEGGATPAAVFYRDAWI